MKETTRLSSGRLIVTHIRRGRIQRVTIPLYVGHRNYRYRGPRYAPKSSEGCYTNQVKRLFAALVAQTVEIGKEPLKNYRTIKRLILRDKFWHH